jgi:murein L,D-transpeptidase YafK
MLVLAMAAMAAAICLMPQTGNSGPADRVEDARQRRVAGLRETFQKCGVRWPAAEVFLRAMKREGEIELWAGNGAGEALCLVKTFPVLAQSGGPGPKRREGDMQVPEGFYEVNRFNPRSNFHLSLGVNYPNASDRVLADPSAPGFDIFIHGGNVSVGCLARGDPAIEELYLAAAASRGRPIHVHFFPARMNAPDWPAWRDAQLQKRPELRAFWEQLAAGWDCFERKRRVPRIEVGADGAYRCSVK